MLRLFVFILLFLTACNDELVLGQDEVPESEAKLAAEIKTDLKAGRRKSVSDKIDTYLMYFPAGSSSSAFQVSMMKSLRGQQDYVRLETFSQSVHEGVSDTNRATALFYRAVANYELAREALYKMIGMDSAGGTDVKRLYTAVAFLDDFIAANPKHENYKEAKEIRRLARERIAAHHLSIAKYYEKAGRPEAGAARIAEIKQSYADTDVAKSLSKKAA